MRVLKILIFISILLITLFTVSSKPVMHKHFIIENSNFKMTGMTANPRDMQSSVLFKLGERKKRISRNVETTTTETQLYRSSDKQIIPSTIFSSFQTTQTPSNVVKSEPRHSDKNTYNDSNNVVVNSNSQNGVNEKELEQVLAEIFDNSAPPQNQTASNRSTRGDFNGGNDEIITNSYCPVCDKHKSKNKKMYEEELAWNVWRSNIQNKLMDTSRIRGDYGEWFIFSFNVSKSRQISRIMIYSSSGDSYSEKSIEKAILNLQGTKILEFPQGTKRTSTVFEGGFIIDTHVQYSRPEDYDDYERVRFYR